MQSLQHPNIVRYLGMERQANMLNIFLEYVPGGSIAGLLKNFGRFDENVVRLYAKQILKGLQYLHSNGIVHLGELVFKPLSVAVALRWLALTTSECHGVDIKGANILVDHEGHAKLGDFGASKRLEGTPPLHWTAMDNRYEDRRRAPAV